MPNPIHNLHCLYFIQSFHIIAYESPHLSIPALRNNSVECSVDIVCSGYALAWVSVPVQQIDEYFVSLHRVFSVLLIIHAVETTDASEMLEIY